MELIDKITNSGVKEGMSFLEKRKLQLVNSISFYTGFVVLFLLLYLLFLKFPKPIIITLALYAGVNFSTFFLVKYISLIALKYLLFLTSQMAILIIGSYFANNDVAYHIATYVWLGTSFNIAFVLFDLKHKAQIISCFLITLLSSYAVHHLDFFMVSNLKFSNNSRPFFLYGNFVGAFCINIITILLFQSSYSEYFKELILNLKNKNRELEEKEGELFTSLEQLRASQAELRGSYELLKEKQNQLQALASNVPGVIFNMEITNNAIICFRYVSTRAKDFFEHDIKDIMLNAELVLSQVLPEFRNNLYSQLLQKGTDTIKLTPEFKVETPSGKQKWIKAEMLSEPIYDDKKQINGVFIDITEEKNREARKERMQKSLLEISNDSNIMSGDIVNSFKMITDIAKETLEVASVSIWLLEKDKNELHCQEHTSDKVTDYARDPIPIKQLEYYRYFLDEHKVIVANDAQTHPATKELFQKKFKPAHVKSCLDADIVLKGAFQGIINCEVCGTLRNWTYDEVQYLNSLSDIISLVLEIHERKKAESEIQRAYSLILSVFDAVEEGLMVVGSDNETLECNNRFMEMFKVPPPLLNKENRRLRIRYIADQLQNGEDFMDKIYSVEKTNEQKFFNVLHLKDGRAIEQFSRPFYVQGRFMGRIWSYRDITKGLRAEENLRSVNSELDTFIYRASHDIKGPLARLRGICNVAKLTVTDKQSSEYFNLLDQESKKLDSILGKLLVVKDLKTNKVKIDKVDFNSIINRSLKYLKYIKDFEKVNLKIQVDNDFEFYSDENLLELIFMNLIDNAIQFHDEEKQFINILIDVYRDNNFLSIRLKDNGIGIEENIIQHIFEMHFRGHERSTGTGLGLYIVKTAVEALQGKVLVQSKPYNGTDFVFSFPIKNLQNMRM